jgi:hypothetical protein
MYVSFLRFSLTTASSDDANLGPERPCLPLRRVTVSQHASDRYNNTALVRSLMTTKTVRDNAFHQEKKGWDGIGRVVE